MEAGSFFASGEHLASGIPQLWAATLSLWGQGSDNLIQLTLVMLLGSLLRLLHALKKIGFLSSRKHREGFFRAEPRREDT